MNIQKTVFTSREIAHVWAHQTQAEGRCPSNMHFDGGAFYSYNTVIARIIEHKGRKAFVLDTESFSNSTSKHQGHVRRALHNDFPTFSVQWGYRRQYMHTTPQELRDWYLSKFNASPCTSRYRHIKAQDFLVGVYHLRNAIEVCSYFRLPKAALERKLLKLTDECESAEQVIAEHRQKLTDRHLERDRIERERRQVAEQGRIKQCIEFAEGDITQLGHDLRGEWASVYFGHNLCYLETRPDLLVKVRAEIQRRDAGLVKDWQNNVPGTVWPTSDGGVIFRLNTDGEVETSKGVKFSVNDATRAFRFIVARRTKGWRRNGETFPIGDYQLDSVGPDGVIAGCHRVGWDEIERFAKVLGLEA